MAINIRRSEEIDITSLPVRQWVLLKAPGEPRGAGIPCKSDIVRSSGTMEP